jgi:dihydrofolate reductase
MRRIIGGVFVSLDGVMQGPGGPHEDTSGGFDLGGWTVPYSDDVLHESMKPLFAEPYDLLLGARTYGIFSTYWPYMTDDPVGQAFNRAAKYVVTSSREPLSWANSHAIDDGNDGVARLKESGGPDLVIWGSGKLYPDLLARGLLDRLYLMTYPVLLGKGKRLFDRGVPSGALKLIDGKVSPSGVMTASYEPAGPVQTGTFEMQPPSEAELARREEMKAVG